MEFLLLCNLKISESVHRLNNSSGTLVGEKRLVQVAPFLKKKNTWFSVTCKIFWWIIFIFLQKSVTNRLNDFTRCNYLELTEELFKFTSSPSILLNDFLNW